MKASKFSRRAVCGALGVLAGLPLAAWAAPTYGEAFITDEKGGEEGAESFSPKARKLYVVAQLKGIGSGGQKLTSVWYAVKTKVAPPNTRIGVAETKAPANAPRITFDMEGPSGGWPKGDYRVDLLINDVKVTELEFSIE